MAQPCAIHNRALANVANASQAAGQALVFSLERLQGGDFFLVHEFSLDWPSSMTSIDTCLYDNHSFLPHLASAPGSHGPTRPTRPPSKLDAPGPIVRPAPAPLAPVSG